MTESQSDAEGDVGLTAVGRSESHRQRAIEHDPRHEDALRELHAHVRLLRAGRHVPVDQPNVVTRHVRAYLGELAAAAEQVRPMLARKKAVDPPADRELEGPEQRLRHRPGAGALRRLDDTECPQASPGHSPGVIRARHAATGLPSSSGGAATVARTASRMSSAVRCSASAR